MGYTVMWEALAGIATMFSCEMIAGLIVGLCPANKRWHYILTTSLIGWVHT